MQTTSSYSKIEAMAYLAVLGHTMTRIASPEEEADTVRQATDARLALDGDDLQALKKWESDLLHSMATARGELTDAVSGNMERIRSRIEQLTLQQLPKAQAEATHKQPSKRL